MWVLTCAEALCEETWCCLSVTAAQPFTVGRLDCSLNLTDDKSVSRKHAEIQCQFGNVALTDLQSRFGTFVNGVKVEPTRLVDLKDGDSVKFGGLQSEFRLARKDIRVFTGKLGSPSSLDLLQPLGQRFDFRLTNEVADAWNYIVFDGPISQLDSDMIVGLTREASFVSIAYFKQLTVSPNSFLPALQQPQCMAFSPQALLPKSGRRLLLASHFLGIRSIYCLNEESFMVVAAIIESQEGEKPVVKKFDPAQMPRFCDLVVVENSPEAELDPSLFRESVRFLAYFSLVNGYVSMDMSEVIIETFHPKTMKGSDGVASARTASSKAALYKATDSALFKTIDSTSPASSSLSSSCISEPQKVPLSDPLHPNESLARSNAHPAASDSSYAGPSLTCVLTENLFRPNVPVGTGNSPSAANNFKRFQKCHPVNYKPGLIPSLIGPDQLVPTTSFAPSAAVTGAGDRKRGRDSLELDDWKPGPNSRRRILVKDAWLEEDEALKENRRNPPPSAPKMPAAKPADEPVRKFQSSLFQNLQNKP